MDNVFAISPRWIIPIIPEGTCLENHSVIIECGKIKQIVPSSDLPKGIISHTLPSHVLTPGFVNAHTHSPMTLLRGLGDDLPLMTWLNETIWPVERQCLDQDFIADGTELAIAEMIQSGTTCFNEHYFQAEVIARVTKKYGMRAQIGFWLGEFTTLDGPDIDAQFNRARNCLKHESEQSDRLHFGLAPHSPYALSDESLKKIHHFSNEFNLRVHMHVHESKDEIDQSMHKYGIRPLERLHQFDLLNEQFQCVHMTQLNHDDYNLLSKHKPHVITCPHSNLKLASGACPTQKLADLGLNIAIGTDGAASNNDLDMLAETQTTALLSKYLSQDASAIHAHYALKMATLNGAKALGIADRVGSIEAGKEADLIAVDLNDWSTLPVYHPASQLVYAANRQQISDVWVQGQALMRNRHLCLIDPHELFEKTALWREKVIKALS